jgi:hypothetical protein
VNDFPALRVLVSESVIGRVAGESAARASDATRASATARVLTSAASAWRTGPAAMRCQVVGVMIAVAGTTHLVLAGWQAPHQAPLAAPVIATIAVIAGVVLLLLPDALRAAWYDSGVRRLWRQHTVPPHDTREFPTQIR